MLYCIICYFLYYKRNKKINVETELLIKDYNYATTAAATETYFDKSLHSEKTGEKEIQMVRTRPSARNQAISSTTKSERDDIHLGCDLLKNI